MITSLCRVTRRSGLDERVQPQVPQRVDREEPSGSCEALSARLRRSGHGLRPYSNVKSEHPSADLGSLCCGHAQFYVEQITASGVADGDDGRMLQLPLR